jgi:hypothetical protein
MLAKRAIDVDPELLRRSAAEQLHAAGEGWHHVQLESTGHVPTILETLVPDGPWAWAIMTHAQPDGSVTLPVQTTFEGIREMYEFIRGLSDVLGADPVIEVRGEWYGFHEDVSTSREKASGTVTEREMVLLMPTTTGPGITGELAWVRLDRQHLGLDVPLADPPKTPLEMRRHLIALHGDLLGALVAGDAEAVAATFTTGAKAAVRDYVADTGTIVGLDDREGIEEHHRRLLERFELRSADVLHQVAQDWYLFTEVRFEGVVRAGPDQGSVVAFHTASIYVPGRDDRFIVHISHGTDLAAMAT